MKSLLIAIPILVLSCQKVKNESMNVIKDCTGVYLRHEGKDYRVGNAELLSEYVNGQAVTASFKRTPKCTGSAADDIVCMLVHENEGWVEVKSIR
jgi:hypothetical protein